METSFRLLSLAPAVMRLPTTIPTRASRVAQQFQQPCRPSNLLRSRAFATTAAQRADPSSSTSRADFDIGKMLDETLEGSKNPLSNRTSHTPSSRFAKESDSLAANRPRAGASSADDFLMNMSGGPSPLSAQGLQMDRMIPSYMEPPPSIDTSLPPLKLNSSTGRQVKVDPERRMDVGRAFRSLEIMCARNSVKRDFMRQRFHERPGLKRKRLKSERWRKNFKAGFKETVKLVMKMKKQGW